MASVSFLYPTYLWLLLLVPFFIFVYFFSLGYNKKKAFVFANFEALERFYGVEFFSRNFIGLYIHLLIVILLVLSLAGTNITFVAETSAYSYVLLVDNSGSMSATDLSPSRFIVAKDAAKDFVDALPLGVAVGVIGFSGEATVYQEITTNLLLAKQGIDNIEFGQVEGTNVYNAILIADRLFDNLPLDRARSVILMSDGQTNIGEVSQILSFAERNSIIINTIAVGSDEGGLSRFNTISKADTDFLKALAFNSGGTFFTVDNVTGFDQAFDALVDTVEDDVTIDISLYLLLIAIALFTISWILLNLRMKTFP